MHPIATKTTASTLQFDRWECEGDGKRQSHSMRFASTSKYWRFECCCCFFMIILHTRMVLMWLYSIHYLWWRKTAKLIVSMVELQIFSSYIYLYISTLYWYLSAVVRACVRAQHTLCRICIICDWFLVVQFFMLNILKSTHTHKCIKLQTFLFAIVKKKTRKKTHSQEKKAKKGK